MMKDFLILVIQTDWKVAKDLATKAATKANEKSAENVGSKTGQLIGVKFVTNLTLAREKKIHDTPKKVGIRDTPKEDKGEELIKLLETQTETKNNTTKRVSKQIFSVVTTGLLIF